MEKKIEEVVSENIQPSQGVIDGKARHQKGTVTAGLAVNPAPHLGVQKKLKYFTPILDKRILLDDVRIVVLKRTFKGIGIDQEDGEGKEEAEKMIFFHGRLAFLYFLPACRIPTPGFLL